MMSNGIQVVSRAHPGQSSKKCDYLSVDKAREVLRFHQSFPQYHGTPLAVLDGLADILGIQSICVKDESYRFGLNAFKVLGGSYAIGQVLAGRIGLSPKQLDFMELTDETSREKLGNITFVTATDGNHGRGIAWTASALGHQSVVYMPRGSSAERLENIRQAGAQAEITEMNYDDAVRFSQRMAEEKGWILVQDTAWEGYEEIPTWIMQGYMTMAYEALLQIKAAGKEKPTHVFLQAGVGSMAAAVAGFMGQAYGDDRPMIIIVEPDQADCMFRTAQADDGTLHCVAGDMHTIMAGLACGEPSTLAWEVLSEYADAFVSCPDRISAKGMRILGNPAADDVRVISGESGAVGVGLVAELMTNPDLQEFKRQLNLDQHARVLIFSTEGDTDRAGYRSVVWDGEYPTV